MDDFLTHVSTTYLKPRREDELSSTEVAASNRTLQSVEARDVTHIASVGEALDTLKSQPDYDSLILVLRFLTKDTPPSGFSLHTPGAKNAAVVHQLVTEIAPNYWTLLQEGSRLEGTSGNSSSSRDAALFIRCLQGVAGLNAILAHLNALIRENKVGSQAATRTDVTLHLGILLDLLANILRGPDTISKIWANSSIGLSSPALEKAQSHALLSLLSGGRVLSVCSEACELLGRETIQPEDRFIFEGIENAQWIAQNIISWAKRKPQGNELQFCSALFQSGLSLGYSDTLTKKVIEGLLLTKGSCPDVFNQIYFSHSQLKKRLFILLHYLSSRLSSIALEDSGSDATISAVAGIIDAVIKDHDALKAHLMDWCTASSAAGLGDGIGIRRAVIAVLAQDKNVITDVLERSLSMFGDQLYIRHVATLQQNVHTEILLLSAGYVSRLSPIKMRIMVRSGPYLSAISNRIAATQTRARFLGMVVGESLSALCDNKTQKLDFQDEEMDTEEAQWLRALTGITDAVGPADSILHEDAEEGVFQQPAKSTTKISTLKPKRKPKPSAEISATRPVAIIEEVDSSEDEDDLIPYAKGSDPEDSDDDATLVQRNKPKAPVYIRDLILYFRDSEFYDKQKLALQTAPSLIRRKANFGTEVSSHADELARLFVGLQDKYDIDNFHELKVQGMVALIVAQPKTMAPWFCQTFFEGDYSLTQRTQVLVAIGLSAGETAGLETSKYASAASFPSKRLPEKIEQLYLDSPARAEESALSSRLRGLPSTALENISRAITSDFLAPMAIEAADKTTGPDILKLETFTARYKSKTRAKPRVRAIPNTTAALLASSFFFPLTAHFQFALRSNKPLILNPALLALYLQTLGVVVHAAGPSTLALPQLTAELWDLLLSVRVHVEGDLGALRGWMIAMVSLLQVNEGDMRRICEQQGREVVETRDWTSAVFSRLRGDDGGEENDVKMLAAGVLIRLGDAIEKFQALLVGDMIG